MLPAIENFASPVVAAKRLGIAVRVLEEWDRDACREILKQHHANTEFRDHPWSEPKFTFNFDRVLARPHNMIGIVAEWNGEVIGLCWMMYDTYMLSEGPPFVIAQVIAVRMENIVARRRAKAFLALVAGIKEWTRLTNSTFAVVQVTTGSNLESTDRLMRSVGVKSIGESYRV